MRRLPQKLRLFHLTGECSSALFVGDGMNDVLASRRAGVRCLLVTHGYADAWADMGADRVVRELSEIEAAARAMNFTF